MALGLLKQTQGPWEQVRNYVQSDLEHLEAAFNRLPAPVVRTIDDYIPDVVSAADFGPVGATQSIQDAVDSFDARRGGKVIIPGGYWAAGAPIIIRTPNVYLEGQGSNFTRLYSLSPTSNVIEVYANDCTISNLGIVSPYVDKTAGAGILAGEDPDNLGSYVDFLRIYNCLITEQWTNINLYTCRNYWVKDCVFQRGRSIQVSISGSLDPDQGDGTIEGCVFSGVVPTVQHILHTGCSGFRLLNNKIIGGLGAYSLVIPTAQPEVLSDILIVGNSIEAQADNHILISRQSGSAGELAALQILCNQMGGITTTGGHAIYIVPDGSDRYVGALNITGNIFSLSATETEGITLAACKWGIVQSNFLTGSGTNVGIRVTDSSHELMIGHNKYTGFAAGKAVVNSSPTSSIQPLAVTALVAWTPGVIANAACASKTVTAAAFGYDEVGSFPRFDPGDIVGVSLDSLDGTVPLILTGVVNNLTVSATGSITVTLANLSGGSVTVAAGTLRVTVFRYIQNTVGN